MRSLLRRNMTTIAFIFYVYLKKKIIRTTALHTGWRFVNKDMKTCSKQAGDWTAAQLIMGQNGLS